MVISVRNAGDSVSGCYNVVVGRTSELVDPGTLCPTPPRLAAGFNPCKVGLKLRGHGPSVPTVPTGPRYPQDHSAPSQWSRLSGYCTVLCGFTSPDMTPSVFPYMCQIIAGLRISLLTSYRILSPFKPNTEI